MNDSIVVYNSRMEQMQDEYWMEFMENHPELILWANAIFFSILALFFMVIAFKVLLTFLKLNKNRF